MPNLRNLRNLWMMTGIILFAHGSPVEEANEGVRELAAKVGIAGPYHYVRAAFLDGGEPDFPTAISQASDAGITKLIVIPYFLTVGLHLRRDLPALIEAARVHQPAVTIVVGDSLEEHPLMPSLILSRIKEVLPS